MDDDDAELIARIRTARSEDAFRSLYRKHAPSLFAFLVAHASTRSEAEEIMQETWTRVVASLASFRGDAAFRTWLFGIAINVARNARRYARPRDDLSGVANRDDGQPTDLVHNRLDLAAALRQLPVGFREVLLLHDVHGYKHREIGEMLGVNEGTSKSQLHRARRAMRLLLDSTAPPRIAKSEDK